MLPLCHQVSPSAFNIPKAGQPLIAAPECCIADNRYRCRSISDGITDVGMDPYGRRPYRVGLLTFVGSDADPRAPDCLKDVTSAQIAIYESLVSARLSMLRSIILVR